jgi:hypothetical protein
VVSFPQISPSKPYMHLFSPPFMLHALTISFFSIYYMSLQSSIYRQYRKICFNVSLAYCVSCYIKLFYKRSSTSHFLIKFGLISLACRLHYVYFVRFNPQGASCQKPLRLTGCFLKVTNFLALHQSCAGRVRSRTSHTTAANLLHKT